MEYITSKQNNSLKHIRLLSKRKYREEFGEYLLEGLRLIKDSLEWQLISSIYIKESLWEKEHSLEELCQGIPYYIVSDDAWSGLALTENDQGILAIGKIKTHDLANFLKKPIEKGSYLLVDQIQEPGNLGALLRSAVAAGVKAIFLTNGSVDLYNPKVVRSAMSALHKVPIFTHLSDEESVALMKNMHTYALAPLGAKSYTEVVYESPSLCVVGNEGNGIRPSLLEEAENSVVIPMEHGMESLNLTIAASIVLFKIKECGEYGK